MSRYELRPVGVFDRELVREVRREDPAWLEYEAWLAIGNVPDPEPVVAMPVLSVRRTEARARLRAARGMRDRVATVTIGADTFACTSQAALRVALMMGAVANGAPYPPDGVVWATVDDRAVTLTAAAFRSLAVAMIQRLDAIATREAQLAASIATSSDPLAEDLDAGW